MTSAEHLPLTNLPNHSDHGVQRELWRLLRQPLVLTALLLQALLTAWLLRGQLENYLALQSGGMRNLSVGDELMTPVLGVAIVALLITAPLVAAALRTALQAPYRRLSAASDRRWLAPSLIAGSVVFLLFPMLLLAQLMLLRLGSAVSLWPLLTAASGQVLLGLFLLWLCVWLSLQVRALAAALAVGYLAMALIAALELQTVVSTPLGLFRAFRDGDFAAAGLVSFALLLLALWRAMVASRTATHAPRRVLLLLLIVLLACAASLLPWRWQPATNAGLSISEQQALQALPDDARLLIVSADPERRRDYVANLQALRSSKPSLQISGQHPDEISAAERDALPGREGLLLSVGGQSAWLKLPANQLAKQSVFWLSGLQRRNAQFLVFLEGHGERSLYGSSARDLTGLRQRLDTLGIRVLPLELRSGLAIPANTGALVLASPSTSYLPEQLRAITDYLDRGGALLWLREPDEPAGFESLDHALGTHRLPGTLLDLAGVKRGTPHPASAVIDHYPQHPALKNVTSLTALPWAAALQFEPSNGFAGQAILNSSSDSLVSADADPATVPLEASRGSFTLGLALTRQLGPRQQRIVVIGDGHFVADTAINNYGNANLALALLQWLAWGEDAVTAVDDRPTDADLFLPAPVLLWFRWGLPVLLPLLLLIGIGAYQWRWRRQ